jgi:hypothetical protein
MSSVLKKRRAKIKKHWCGCPLLPPLLLAAAAGRCCWPLLLAALPFACVCVCVCVWLPSR